MCVNVYGYVCVRGGGKGGWGGRGAFAEYGLENYNRMYAHY